LADGVFRTYPADDDTIRSAGTPCAHS
jgi:hypothetical protein